MSKFRDLLLGLMATASLSACSSDPTGTAPNQLMYDVFNNGVRQPVQANGSQDISQLTRAAIANVDFPLILITLPQVEATSTITVGAIKDQIVTWVSVDRVGVIFDGPVLFGTRGIGPDLLTAEAEELRNMIENDHAGNLTREYRHLNGLDQIDITTFQCQLVSEGAETIVVLERSHRVRKMQETCQTDYGLGIKNIYWTGSDGTLWKSQQWVSSQVGYMVTERLVK